MIQNGETGAREYRPFTWGLIPSWAKDPAIGNRTIMASAGFDGPWTVEITGIRRAA